MDVAVVARRLTLGRLGSYLDLAVGDRERALDLYAWNTRASGALIESIAHTEVLLRNAMDDALTDWAKRKHGGADWFDVAPLDLRGRAEIARARERARRAGGVSHDRIVAELTFGFWVFLASRRYATALWYPGLHRAFASFPGDTAKARPTVWARLDDLKFVRNRAAHHEPIHRRDLLQDAARIAEANAWLWPETAAWAAARCRVAAVVRARPV